MIRRWSGCLFMALLIFHVEALANPALYSSEVPILSAAESGQASWGPVEMASELPDFSLSSNTRGPVDVESWRQATVIVVSRQGFGSGALISSDGWILTNYHVVADAVQLAASNGGIPVRVEIITCEIRNGALQRRPESIPASVYRASPSRDLALIKLDRLPGGLIGMPHFELAVDDARTLDVCYVIGSQGNGPAWMVRKGEIANDSSRYPENMTNFVTGIDSAGAVFQRMQASILVSNCPVSPGDSGGPLLNEQGQLIGLTFATPSNFSGGAIGYHVSGAEIRGFVTPRPSEPEAAPFDSWMAGMVEGQMTGPNLFTVGGSDGRNLGAIRYAFVEETAEGPQLLAIQTYFSFRNAPFDEGTTARDVVPAGLWEQTVGGHFPVDFSLLVRKDNLTAMAYSTGEDKVGEIRIDLNSDRNTDVLWTMGAGGKWMVVVSPRALPLLDTKRLESGLVDFLTTTLNDSPWK